MTDNPSYRGGQGQGRPGDEYYDDRYARPQEDRATPARTRRGRLPARAGRLPAPSRAATPTTAADQALPDQRGGYPEQGGYPDQRGGYPDQGGYPTSAAATRASGGYPDQGGYPTSAAATPTSAAATAAGPAGGYGGQQRQGGYDAGDYGRPAPAAGYGALRRLRAPAGRLRPYPGRPAYPDQGGYGTPSQRRRLPRAGRRLRPGLRRRPGIRPAGLRPARLRPLRRRPAVRRLRAAAGYAEPGRDYDYGQPPRRRLRPRRLRPGRLPAAGADGHPAARRRQRPHLPAARGRQRHRPRPGRAVPAARHRRVASPPGDPVGRPGRAAVRPQLHQRHHRQQRAGAGVAAGRRRRDPAGPLRDHRPHPLSHAGRASAAVLRPRVDRRPSIVTLPKCSGTVRRDGDAGRRGRQMQGLVLQLTRAGFLMLLWLFIWSVLRILRTDIYAPTGAVMVRRGLGVARHAAAVAPAPDTRPLSGGDRRGAGRHPHHAGRPAGADRPRRRLHAGAHRRLRLDAARPAVSARLGMVRRRSRIDQRHIP